MPFAAQRDTPRQHSTCDASAMSRASDFFTISTMSDWVLGYHVSVSQLAEYAYAHQLCTPCESRLRAMQAAVAHIADVARLPQSQRSLALCWTMESKHDTEPIWKLSERFGTRSSSELQMGLADLPPNPLSLVKLAKRLGKDHPPRWYLREASYSPVEGRIWGWSDEDVAAVVKTGTRFVYALNFTVEHLCRIARAKYNVQEEDSPSAKEP